MNKRILFSLFFILFLASLSYAQMAGSAHDFSGENWNNTGEMCVVCHTPHNADATVMDAPLWNHEVTASTFTVYTGGGTMDATTGQPDGVSKLCLSCHDGTVAVDNFGGKTNGTEFITGDDNLGTDLSNDHPVSFAYDAALASLDGGLFDPTTTNSGLGGTIDGDMLFNGSLECASCHDVHDATNISKLLVKSNSGSALCLTCHNK
jgi:predicted CXXCH cytochrome family protein